MTFAELMYVTEFAGYDSYRNNQQYYGNVAKAEAILHVKIAELTYTLNRRVEIYNRLQTWSNEIFLCGIVQ